MRTSEQIVEDAKNNDLKEDYSLLEVYLYLCIIQILKMFSNRQITKDDANRYKLIVIKKYEDMKKQYDFEKSMFEDFIQASNKTCGLRIELRKKWKDDTSEVTNEGLAELLNMAMEILSVTYEGEF